MPKQENETGHSGVVDDLPLTTSLAEFSELAGILGALGIAGEGNGFSPRENPRELVRTATAVLCGLSQQQGCVRIQRNMLAVYGEDWFWRWDIRKGTIRIETPPSPRGPKKHIEAGSWHSLSDPEDVDALKAIDGFPASGRDLLEVGLRMRGAAGDWREVQWKGQIAERDKSGHGLLAAGTLKLRHIDAPTAEASNGDEMRAKLDFLANISHEIRTPMTAILGASCLATETDDPVLQKELARTIRASTESLVGLLDDALDFTRIEAGMIELEAVDFDLHALVGETARIHGLDAMRKGLAIILRVSAKTPVRVISDPVRIRQIVANLLGNAVKFTHRGEIELSVDAHPLPDDDATWAVRISVRDTGIGVSPEKRAMIFEMFTQADASTKRRFGGTGIGLSISRRLAALLGGSVEVDSPAGEGSVFRLDIVVKTPPAPQTSPRHSAVAGKRVLIVEGNRAQRAALAETIAALGAIPDALDEADEQPSFEQAVRSRREPPHIVLADAELPCVRSMMADRRLPPAIDACRVIVMRNAGSAGWNSALPGYANLPSLLKPFTPADLEAALVSDPENASRSEDMLDTPELQITGLGDVCPRRILLAEDNDTSRDIIAAILLRAGYEVDAVTNGAEAVEAFQKDVFAYSIVMMDIQMPVMDGFEAAEEIRACEERRSWIVSGNWHSTPILAMTADALKDIDARCRDAGMHSVLIKPSTPEMLIATINRIIAESERGAIRIDPAGANREQPPTADDRDDQPFKLSAIQELSRRLDKTLLDLDAPLRWSGNDASALKRLVASFLSEVPAFSQQLDRLLAGSQLADAARLVHKMKSSLRMLGAVATAGCADRLWQACQDDDREQARRARDELKTSLRHLGQLLDIVSEIA